MTRIKHSLCCLECPFFRIKSLNHKHNASGHHLDMNHHNLSPTQIKVQIKQKQTFATVGFLILIGNNNTNTNNTTTTTNNNNNSSSSSSNNNNNTNTNTNTNTNNNNNTSSSNETTTFRIPDTSHHVLILLSTVAPLRRDLPWTHPRKKSDKRTVTKITCIKVPGENHFCGENKC